MDTPPDDDATRTSHDDDRNRGFPRWLKWALLGALAVLVVGYGLIFLYAKVLNDSPDEFDEDDLAAALTPDTVDPTTSTGPATTASPATTAATTGAAESTVAPTTDPTVDTDPPAPATTTPEAPAESETWSVTDDSELGYRVKEILFGVDTEAVGRTNQITGSLDIDGTRVTRAEFVVDVASIESDEGRRDSRFRSRIMSTDEFPTATFALTEPLELGTAAVDGATVDTEATGDLTLRGVTNQVTFGLTASLENDRIAVLGRIPVLFADYGIANPSTGGITTEDNGLLEFVLVFEQD